MKVYLELTHCEYDLNYREARLALREHLLENGFFKYPEHKEYWDLVEQKEAQGDSVKGFIDSIFLFTAVKLGKVMKAD